MKKSESNVYEQLFYTCQNDGKLLTNFDFEVKENICNAEEDVCSDCLRVGGSKPSTFFLKSFFRYVMPSLFLAEILYFIIENTGGNLFILSTLLNSGRIVWVLFDEYPLSILGITGLIFDAVLILLGFSAVIYNVVMLFRDGIFSPFEEVTTVRSYTGVKSVRYDNSGNRDIHIGTITDSIRNDDNFVWNIISLLFNILLIIISLVFGIIVFLVLAIMFFAKNNLKKLNAYHRALDRYGIKLSYYSNYSSNKYLRITKNFGKKFEKQYYYLDKKKRSEIYKEQAAKEIPERRFYLIGKGEKYLAIDRQYIKDDRNIINEYYGNLIVLALKIDEKGEKKFKIFLECDRYGKRADKALFFQIPFKYNYFDESIQIVFPNYDSAKIEDYINRYREKEPKNALKYVPYKEVRIC